MTTVILLLVFVVLLVIVGGRNRREQQRRAAAVASSLVPGTRVMTTAGLHGTVVEVGDTTVVLEIAPGVLTTWARAAVARSVETGTGPVDPPVDGPLGGHPEASAGAPAVPAESSPATAVDVDGQPPPASSPSATHGASTFPQDPERPSL